MGLVSVMKRLWGRGATPPLELGKAALERGDHGAALEQLSEALKRDPAASEAHFHLGVLHAEQGKQRDALEHYRRCLELGARSASLLNNLAAAHAALGEEAEAARRFEDALALEPDHPQACMGLGRILQERGEDARALDLYDRALRRDPGSYAASFHKAQILLARGEFREGFKHFAARPNRIFSPLRQRFKFHRGALPRDLSGKSVFVIGEHTGIGDDLFYARFLPELQRRGARIAYGCGARAAMLLEGSVASELLRDGAAPQWQADYVLPAGDLAYALKLWSREALPPPLPLRVDEAARVRARRLLAEHGPRPYVGVTWRAGSEADSAAPAHWSPLTKVAPLAEMLAALGDFGGTVLAVQRKIEPHDLAHAQPRVVDLSDQVADLALTLAILAELDEYLCVPNTHMHMRIGAGGGCRILEPFPSDWRLEASGATSCWYPGSRVYRQARNGDWEAELAGLRGELPPALADAHGRAGADWLNQARRLQTEAIARRKRDAGADRCYREALRHFAAATRLQPERAQAHRARGGVLQELGELEAARDCYAEARRLAPEDPVLAGEHAGALLATGEVRAAIAAYESALARHPGEPLLHGGLALALLGAGEFARGWDEYEWRLMQPDAATQRTFPFARWQGEPLAGKTLLVTSEQGIGDEVMFASCFGELIDAAAHCVLEVSTRLVPLFRRSFPRATILTRQLAQAPDWATLPRIDFCIAAGSVPRLLRRSRDAFPRRERFLEPDPARVRAWRERLAIFGAARTVGLAWTGGLPGTWRAARSLELAALRPVLAQPGHAFVALEYLDCGAEVEAFNGGGPERVTWWPEINVSIDDTAALVAALDLVISVTTATAHIAGALGRPVWVMVPSVPSWRYLWEGHAMPWYPSMRIFRGRGSREEAVAQVQRALAAAGPGGAR